VPGAPIFRLAETQVIWVQAMVDEAEIGKLKVGQPAQVVFRFSPSQPRRGRVTRLGREADRVTEELQVDVTVEDLPPNYFLGQKADVFVETSRKADALQVPKIAIIRRDRTPGVFVLSAGRARWREVKLGLVGRENVEVLSGVTEGDIVIVQPFIGKVAISEGQRISPAEKAEAP
jgi:HlyD family secretion protein